MKRNGSTGFALLLIACGALIVLGKLGFGFGHFLGYLIPAALVVLGYFRIKNGSRFFGWGLLVLGLILLLAKFSMLIGLIIAVGMIGYGVSMLKNSDHAA